MTAQILYSESLVQSWESSLASAFAQPGLRLTRRTVKTADRFNVQLQSSISFETLHADQVSPPKAKIRAPGIIEDRYLFAFKATFELWTVEPGRPRSHILQHASLTVLQDVALTGPVPIFRAEWDPRAVDDSESRHAQPHWHFIHQAEAIETLVNSVFEEQQEFGAETKSSNFAGLSDLGKFHFSMSSFFDDRGTTQHKQGFQSEQELTEWFRSLNHYIAGQLAYICTKSSLVSIGGGVAVDFVAQEVKTFEESEFSPES